MKRLAIHNDPIIAARERKAFRNALRLIAKKGIDAFSSVLSPGFHGRVSLSLIHRHTWSVNITRALLDLGADINKVALEGGKALTIAIFCGHRDTVQLLLERGASTSIVWGKKTTLLDKFVDRPWGREPLAYLENLMSYGIKCEHKYSLLNPRYLQYLIKSSLLALVTPLVLPRLRRNWLPRDLIKLLSRYLG